MDDENREGWTVITLKEHIETVLIEHDRRFEQRFAAQEKAIYLALASKETNTEHSYFNVTTLIALAALVVAGFTLFRH